MISITVTTTFYYLYFINITQKKKHSELKIIEKSKTFLKKKSQ